MELNKQEQFAEIVQIIHTAHSNAVKSVNAELINAYWNVGAYISQEVSSSNWGEIGRASCRERVCQYV